MDGRSRLGRAGVPGGGTIDTHDGVYRSWIAWFRIQEWREIFKTFRGRQAVAIESLWSAAMRLRSPPHNKVTCIGISYIHHLGGPTSHTVIGTYSGLTVPPSHGWNPTCVFSGFWSGRDLLTYGTKNSEVDDHMLKDDGFGGQVLRTRTKNRDQRMANSVRFRCRFPFTRIPRDRDKCWLEWIVYTIMFVLVHGLLPFLCSFLLWLAQLSKCSNPFSQEEAEKKRWCSCVVS